MEGDIVYRFAYVWVACWEVASFVHKLKGFSGWEEESRVVRTGCARKNQSQNFDYVTRPYFVYNHELKTTYVYFIHTSLIAMTILEKEFVDTTTF